MSMSENTTSNAPLVLYVDDERPNRIVFHTGDEMKELHQVGIALKEQKVVDHRPKAEAPPHVDVRPPTLTPATNGVHVPVEVHS